MTISAVEAGRRFRQGLLTPTDLTEELLGRIADENPRLNAYYEVFGAEARRSAAIATRELRDGRDRGPLHGIPIAVKDLFDVAAHSPASLSASMLPRGMFRLSPPSSGRWLICTMRSR